MDQAASSRNEGGEVVPLNLSVPAEKPEQDHELRAEYVRQVRVAIDMLNARLLGLIAVLGGVGIWAWAVTSPLPWTFIVGCGYSVGVIFPTIWLYSRRGQ
jgi:hypothetical protein